MESQSADTDLEAAVLGFRQELDPSKPLSIIGYDSALNLLDDNIQIPR